MRITNREDVYRADDHEYKREDVYIAEYLSVILVRICTVTKGAPPLTHTYHDASHLDSKYVLMMEIFTGA